MSEIPGIRGGRVEPVLSVASIQGEGPRTPPDNGKKNKRPSRVKPQKSETPGLGEKFDVTA